MKTLGRLLVLLGTALSGSCGNATEQMIQRYRAGVEAKLAAIQAIGARLPAEVVPTGAPFVLTGPPPSFGDLGSGTNAIVMEEGHFATGAPLLEGFHLSPAHPLADPSSLLSGGEFAEKRPGTLELKEALLKDFSAVRYVLVLRRMELKAPVVKPVPRNPSLPPGAPKPDFLYEKGTSEGDLILFDLEQQKSVGGFRYYGESSPTITTTDLDPVSKMNNMLQDLRANTARSIKEEFQRRYASAVPPFARY